MELNYPNAGVGECPNCGNLSIDTDTVPQHDADGHIVYNYTCSRCNFEGQEVYDVVFIRQRKRND